MTSSQVNVSETPPVSREDLETLAKMKLMKTVLSLVSLIQLKN